MEGAQFNEIELAIATILNNDAPQSALPTSHTLNLKGAPYSASNQHGHAAQTSEELVTAN